MESFVCCNSGFSICLICTSFLRDAVFSLKEKLKAFEERLVEERKKRLEDRRKQRKEERRNAYYRQKEEEAQRIHEEHLKKGNLVHLWWDTYKPSNHLSGRHGSFLSRFHISPKRLLFSLGGFLVCFSFSFSFQFKGFRPLWLEGSTFDIDGCDWINECKQEPILAQWLLYIFHIYFHER